MLNLMPAIDAAPQAATARMSSGRGPILPSAAATPRPRTESVPRPGASWDGGVTGHGVPRIAANPALTGLGDLGNQGLLAGQRDAYAQCTTRKQFPYTTRFAAPSGDAQGPHPARDPV
jgi:hypothetical protein